MKLPIRQLFFIALTLQFVGYAYGKDAAKLEIVDFGIYDNKFTRSQVKSDNVVADVIKPSYSMELVKKTDVIEAKIGTTFGFRFIPGKVGKFDASQVLFCGEHPPMKNPATGKVATKECFNHYIKPGKLQWHTYAIENS